MGWLTAVRLSNTGNDCYQNSALLAMFWALLQLGDPTWNDLGGGAEEFAELFRSEGMWVSLKDLPTLGAHDLHEFLSRFLQWIRPLCVNSSWRRIAQEGGVILSKDQGAPYNPPTLSAPEHTGKIELQHLADSWTEYMGAQTFSACSRLACLHLDRFALDH